MYSLTSVKHNQKTVYIVLLSTDCSERKVSEGIGKMKYNKKELRLKGILNIQNHTWDRELIYDKITMDEWFK